MKVRVFDVTYRVHQTIGTFRWEWLAAVYCEVMNALGHNYRYTTQEADK